MRATLPKASPKSPGSRWTRRRCRPTSSFSTSAAPAAPLARSAPSWPCERCWPDPLISSPSAWSPTATWTAPRSPAPWPPSARLLGPEALRPRKIGGELRFRQYGLWGGFIGILVGLLRRASREGNQYLEVLPFITHLDAI